MVQGKVRRDRIHATGISNRPRGTWNPMLSLETQKPGPTHTDPNSRSNIARDLEFHMDMKVPITNTGDLNRDFSHTIPGKGFQDPGTGGPTGARTKPRVEHPMPLSHVWHVEEGKQTELNKTIPTATLKGIQTITAKDPETGEILGDENGERKGKTRAFVAQARWDPKLWWRDAEYWRDPANKQDGEPWNFQDSGKRPRNKGQDRLMRSCTRPSECGSPRDDWEEREGVEEPEYWPGRDTADRIDESPFNDFQVRPVHLPDMFVEPGPLTYPEKVHRMKRLREYFRQRYGGRPTLLKAFRNLSLEKPGYIVAADLQLVLDQMGIKAERDECQLLIESSDKDYKGALTYDEFADLVYCPDIEVGGAPTQAQERHVRHVTRDTLLGLAQRFPKLQRFFLETDPERRHIINKEQFTGAVSSCMNHVTQEAIDFLWAANFDFKSEEQGGGRGPPKDYDSHCVDWRGFMQHLANFAHMHRPPTPVCVRSKKSKKDQVMRTTALTGGELPDMEWPGPEQKGDDDVCIVADSIRYKEKELKARPQECNLKTYNLVDTLRTKAINGHRMLAKKVPRKMMEHALKGVSRINRDQLVELIMGLVADNDDNKSNVTKSVRSWDSAELGPIEPRIAPTREVLRADIQSLVNTEFVDKDDDVDIRDFTTHVYEWKSKLAEVNDGFNPALRGLRPKRQRPERGRYDNYWRARMIMETITDAMEPVEVSNGGKLKSSKVFKRLDMDGDGYVSIDDIQNAFRRYKVQGDLEDVHSLMTALDPANKGAVDIGEFTRTFVTYQGNILDNMSRPIEGVADGGGTYVGGPANRDVPPGYTQRSDEGSQRSSRAGVPNSQRSRGTSQISAPAYEKAESARSTSVPKLPTPNGPNGDGQGAPAFDDDASSRRSQSSIRTRGSAIDRLFTRPERITDVIQRRCDAWKPKWTDLYEDGSRPGRFSWTLYPDTRHVSQPLDPKSGSYLAPEERFKTTSSMANVFSNPDYQNPQINETMKKNCQRDFKLERIRKRQCDMAERREVAEMAAKEFDERRLARKALSLLEYERRVPITSA